MIILFAYVLKYFVREGLGNSGYRLKKERSRGCRFNMIMMLQAVMGHGSYFLPKTYFEVCG